MSTGNPQPQLNIETGNTLEAKVNKLRSLAESLRHGNEPKSLGIEEAIQIIESGKNLSVSEISKQLEARILYYRSKTQYGISTGIDAAAGVLRE